MSSSYFSVVGVNKYIYKDALFFSFSWNKLVSHFFLIDYMQKKVYFYKKYEHSLTEYKSENINIYEISLTSANCDQD